MVAGSNDTPPQSEVIFVIECTATSGLYFNEIKTNYLVPTLEYFHGGALEEGSIGGCTYAAVICRSADARPASTVSTLGPYNCPHQFLNDINKLQFIGGRAEGNVCLAEGLSIAINCFEELNTSRRSTEVPAKHLIIMCASPPYTAAAGGIPGFGYINTAEEAAALLGERGVNLSVITPRKLNSLVKIFERSGGELATASARQYAKDARHMVLLRGMALQERAPSPAPPPQTDAAPPSSTIPGHEIYRSASPRGCAGGYRPTGGTPPRWVPAPPPHPSRPYPPQSALITQLREPVYTPREQFAPRGVGPAGNQGQMGGPGGPMGVPGGPMSGPGGAMGGPGQGMPGPGGTMGPGVGMTGNNQMGGSQSSIGGPGTPMGGSSNAMGGPGNAMGGPGNAMGGPSNALGGPGNALGGTAQGQGGPAGAMRGPGLPGQANTMTGAGAQSGTAGPSAGGVPQGAPGPPQRKYIWQGTLEWTEKGKGPGDQQKISRQVACSVSISIKDSDGDLKAELWPRSLMMQLMPKQLIGTIGGKFLKDSKSVIFHPQPCEALDSLTKVLVGGFAGCVHFYPPQCEIKVLILLYTSDKKAFLGFIPNDQAKFVEQLRHVIQQQKNQKATSPGAGGPGAQGPGSVGPSGIGPGPGGVGPGVVGPGGVGPGQNAGGPSQPMQQQTMGGPMGQQEMQNMQPGPPNMMGGMGRPLDDLEVARQQNLEKIQQLQQTLEAAQKQETLYKSQMDIMSHLHAAKQQEQQYKQLEDQRQKQAQLAQLQQHAALQQALRGAAQMRMRAPHMPAQTANPGLRHLLQQQPQYRTGGPTRPTQPQQFDDVPNYDFI